MIGRGLTIGVGEVVGGGLSCHPHHRPNNFIPLSLLCFLNVSIRWQEERQDREAFYRQSMPSLYLCKKVLRLSMLLHYSSGRGEQVLVSFRKNCI